MIPILRNTFFCLTVLIFSDFLGGCKTEEEKGREHAKIYCSSCHQFPDPSLLDKKTWETSVLPQMAFRMGFNDFKILSEIDPKDLEIVLKAIPANPIVTPEQWNEITKYYLANAPDSISLDERTISDTIRLFSPQVIQTVPIPFITFIKIDTLEHFIFAGDRMGRLFKMDTTFQLLETHSMRSPASHINVHGDSIFISTMGIMDPNDRPAGQLALLTKSHQQVLIDSIKRPVFFEKTDLNGDALDDFIICAFGNFTGDLSVYSASANGYEKHLLNDSPGARKTIVKDFNHDGRKDILVLMAQGDERILLYTNEGDLNFKEEVLLRFSPLYGSSYIEISDFNGDGFFDILTASGDNADYSMILKPYHGLRIYENDGENHFKEAWFFAMPGASMAMARDFDKDGDIDIAAVSFFPDFRRHPEESFIYFENNRGYNFKPQTIAHAIKGRWLVMEAGDYDNDGDEDIMLGAMNFRGLGASTTNSKNWSIEPTPILLLSNALK